MDYATVDDATLANREIVHKDGEINRRMMNAKIDAADRLGLLLDRRWRLNNLYFTKHIKHKCPYQFRMTPDHERMYYHQHVDVATRNHIVLKSRQVFMTTYGVIRMLDACSLQRNVKCVLSNWSEDETKKTVKEKAWYTARESPWLQNLRPVLTNSGVHFPRTNSDLIVSVTGRGGTADYVHITEFGKTSEFFPDKAAEVLDGMSEGVEYGHMLIESTSKGASGPFPAMVREAQQLMRSGARPNRIQYMLHFIAWWNKVYNVLEGHTEPEYDAQLAAYFHMVEEEVGTKLSEEQRNWYFHTLKSRAQNDWRRMKMERPSTIEEALSADAEGYVMNEFVTRMYDENRVGEYRYTQGEPVVCFWDFGFSDQTAVIFVQREPNTDMYLVIDSLAGTGRWLEHYFGEVGRRGYNIASHVLPWDAEAQNTQLKQLMTRGRSESIKAFFQAAGYNNLVVMPRVKPKMLGFQMSRAKSVKVKVASGNKEFLRSLKDVRKDYHAASGRYANELRKGAVENHYYDCFELFARTLDKRPDLWEPGRVLWTPMSQHDMYGQYRRLAC